MVALVQHLAWPVVALIAFIGLKGHAVRLADGAICLKKILDDPSDLLKILNRISDAQEVLQKEAKDTRETVEILNIKEGGNINLAASPTAADPTPDQMFAAIKGEWDAIVVDLRRRADGVGINTNLVGYVGVNSTVEDLVKKGAMSAAAGELVKAVSTRWQPMLRNQPRKAEWLTPQVFVSFQKLAEQAKRALAA